MLDIAQVQSEPWVEYQGHGEKSKLPVPSDSQLVLVFSYPPTYPAAALARGIEGYAVVGFSVSGSGAVFDPFIIEFEPAGVFDRASLKAILKFKYKAKMVDGKPVSTDGQRYMLSYNIDT